MTDFCSSIWQESAALYPLTTGRGTVAQDIAYGLVLRRCSAMCTVHCAWCCPSPHCLCIIGPQVRPVRIRVVLASAAATSSPASTTSTTRTSPAVSPDRLARFRASMHSQLLTTSNDMFSIADRVRRAHSMGAVQGLLTVTCRCIIIEMHKCHWLPSRR